MKMNPMGRTGILVSELCLGTMTWGFQNTEEEGHAQMDRALDAGINFVDTAEMYPSNPEVGKFLGQTEEIIGSWHEKTGRRGDYILATKHSGAGMKYARDGAPITAQSIPEAIEHFRHQEARSAHATLEGGVAVSGWKRHGRGGWRR